MSEPTSDEKVMPFLQHLEELRRTLLYVIGAVMGGAILAWVFSKRVLDWLIGRTSGEAIFIKPQGAIIAQLKVALVLGLLVTLPFVFYKIWSFVGPGLMARERKVVLPGSVTSVILFYLGLVFSYFVLTPLAVQALLNFGGPRLTAQTEVNYLLDLVFTMGLASGLIFQLPLFVGFLTAIGILNSGMLRAYWRHALVATFILAALLTPADPLTQMIMAVPLIVLYGFSYLVAWVIERGRKKEPGTSVQTNKEEV